MSVFFVLRSHYVGPSERHIRRFDDATVLDWFRARWSLLAADEEQAPDRAEEILGTDVYGFGSLGAAIAEHGLAPPATMEELYALLQAHLYVEGEISPFGEDHLQVLTDDDELQLAYYFFDDVFLRDHPGHAAFLLHDGWRLPPAIDTSPPRAFVPVVESSRLDAAGGDGCVWIVLLTYYDSGNLDLAGPRTVSGIRVAELAPWLAAIRPRADYEWPIELRMLRSQLLVASDDAPAAERECIDALLRRPTDPASWAVYSDWLIEHGSRRAGTEILDRALSRCGALPIADIGSGAWKDRCCGDLLQARRDAEALCREATKSRTKSRTTQTKRADRSLVAVDEHIAQICLFAHEWTEGQPMYHQWIFFDDVWAAAHPDVANGLLRFAARWDVLSG